MLTNTAAKIIDIFAALATIATFFGLKPSTLKTTRHIKVSHASAWLCCSNVLPLRGEQQATDNYPAKGTFLFVNSLFG